VITMLAINQWAQHSFLHLISMQIEPHLELGL
jgi:hypothetical protein